MCVCGCVSTGVGSVCVCGRELEVVQGVFESLHVSVQALAVLLSLGQLLSVLRAWLSSSRCLMATRSSCISPLCCVRRLAASLLACSVWLLPLARVSSLNWVNSCSSTARLSLRVLRLLYTLGELGVQWAGGAASLAGALWLSGSRVLSSGSFLKFVCLFFEVLEVECKLFQTGL